MKTEYQIIEEYIDYYNERKFVESLTTQEQILYRISLRDTYSYLFFKLYVRMQEFFRNFKKKIESGVLRGQIK